MDSFVVLDLVCLGDGIVRTDADECRSVEAQLVLYNFTLCRH